MVLQACCCCVEHSVQPAVYVQLRDQYPAIKGKRCITQCFYAHWPTNDECLVGQPDQVIRFILAGRLHNLLLHALHIQFCVHTGP
jgi:hypothetical protein